MIDPLSVAASAIAVSQAVIGGLNILQTLHQAPAEIHSLMNDISDLRVLIQEIHKTISHFTDSNNPSVNSFQGLWELFNRANSKLEELNQIVRLKLIPRNESGKRMPTLTRLRWFHEKPRIREIQKELTELKLSIGTLFGAATSLDISRIYLKLENISLVSAQYIPEQLREPSPDTRLLQAAPQVLSDLGDEISASGILEQPILLNSTDGNPVESTESLVKGPGILNMSDATIASPSSSIEEVPRSPETPDSMTAYSSGSFELNKKQAFDTMLFDSGIGMSDDGTQLNKEMQISSPSSTQSPDDNPFTNIRGVRVAVS